MQELIPFGKYKGQPVEVLQNDPQYLDWLSSQDWFKRRYKQLNQIIINNFNEPSETPEHNALQAKFVDDEFVRKFIGLVNLKKFENDIYKPVWVEPSQVLFENGFDVSIDVSIGIQLKKDRNKEWHIHKAGETDETGLCLHIEIKPCLGDDYPAILRQIKSQKGCNFYSGNGYILLYDKFTAQGATIDQVKKIFAPIRVVSVSEIENKKVLK